MTSSFNLTEIGKLGNRFVCGVVRDVQYINSWEKDTSWLRTFVALIELVMLSRGRRGQQPQKVLGSLALVPQRRLVRKPCRMFCYSFYGFLWPIA
jgi:hypothetical protein